MKYLSVVLCLLLGLSPNLSAQMGCTDPQANNYDPNALENDGSCVYPDTDYTLNLISNLPSELGESSGLAFTLNQLWTQNDGGNADQLFQIDSLNGAIPHTLTLSNAGNIDWEDLAEDESYLYVGDFGNNQGDRMDLRIFRLKKTELSNDVIDAEVIEFSFSDQTIFTPNPNNHNFDCEAFFAHQDSLHLFSKNWQNGQTRHYVLPTIPGQYIAQVRDSFNAGGLITAADIDEEGSVVLLGYNGLSNFMWLLFDYPQTGFFDGNKRRINLGSTLNNGQTEGIAFREKGYGYISSEAVSLINLPARLYSFSIREWTEPIVSTSKSPRELAVQVFPNPVGDEWHISTTKPLGNINVQYFDRIGRLVHQQELNSTSTTMQIHWPKQLLAGLYMIKACNGEGACFSTLLYKN